MADHSQMFFVLLTFHFLVVCTKILFLSPLQWQGNVKEKRKEMKIITTQTHHSPKFHLHYSKDICMYVYQMDLCWIIHHVPKMTHSANGLNWNLTLNTKAQHTILNLKRSSHNNWLLRSLFPQYPDTLWGGLSVSLTLQRCSPPLWSRWPQKSKQRRDEGPTLNTGTTEVVNAFRWAMALSKHKWHNIGVAVRVHSPCCLVKL